MANTTKPPRSKRPRDRLTAKTVHKNTTIDFFSKDDSQTDETDETPPPKVTKTSVSGPKRGQTLSALLDDKREFKKMRENSERFYDQLLNHNVDSDITKLIVYDQDYLDDLVKNTRSEQGLVAPLLNHPKASSYGFILIDPESRCGPLINTRGVMVIIFIHVDDEMVFFESLNSLEKKRMACKSQFQVLVIPNEVFVIHNESTDVTARLLAISCKKKWKDFNDLKDRKVVPLDGP